MNVADVKKKVDKIVEIGIFGPSRMPQPKAKEAPAPVEEAKSRRPPKPPVQTSHASAR